ncbi:MAG: hypothetical protein ACI85K_001873 [Hyphomicrobiaceae bacterium]|jgi:hypothetical protein
MTGTVSNTPSPICVVAIGFNNTSMPGHGALPFDLNVIGMTGCQPRQSNENYGFATEASGQAFIVDWVYALPKNAALLAVHHLSIKLAILVRDLLK